MDELNNVDLVDNRLKKHSPLTYKSYSTYTTYCT